MQEKMYVIHHSERIAFPKDGKKAKTVFEKYKETYDRYCCVNHEEDLYRSELAFYKARYGKTMDAMNRKHKISRHTERMVNERTLHGGSRSCPEELRIRIGNAEDHVDRQILLACLDRYVQEIREWNEETGNHMHILNIQVSKAAPYMAVIRRVWDYMDDDGLYRIGQSQALTAAGILPPDPQKEITRYNNPKMAFDKYSRELFLHICEENGLSVQWKARIYTLEKALEKRQEVEAERKRHRAMLKEILELEKSMPETSDCGIFHEDGTVTLTAEDYKMLIVRNALLQSYETHEQAESLKLLEMMERYRKEELELSKKQAELLAAETEYAVIRTGLLCCGYSLGNEDAGGEDYEDIP